MARKTGKPERRNPNQITMSKEPGETEASALARTVLRPTVQAAVTLREYGKSYGDLELAGLVDALSVQTKATTDGDLARAEAMLTVQAHTLDAIFNNLAQRAALNMGEYMQACDTYLKLALRAQSQCRATWEGLATIKNPPMVGYVGQANIAHGHQQVNNAPAVASDTSRAREIADPQNKLLEQKDGERLDTGATGAAGGADPAMAPVGKVDRPEDSERQGEDRAKRIQGRDVAAPS